MDCRYKQFLLFLLLFVQLSTAFKPVGGRQDESTTTTTKSTSSRLKSLDAIDHDRDNNDPVARYNPVLFIPGDGGSQLEAKLDKPGRVHYLCRLKSDWYDLWLNIHLLTPGAFDCLIDNMRLTYDRSSRTTQNSPGVQIRATKFGSLASVDYLDLYHFPLTGYFETIIASLEAKNGLTREIDMLGASYDFRKAPNELGEYFANLARLIEELYAKSNYRPVTLICHSMGCLNSLYLLNGKDQKWKDTFVKRLITLGAPWSGSFKAISAMMFGDNLGIPLLNKVKLQTLQSTFPSLMYLFPREPTFERQRVLVQTPEQNYTLANFEQFFTDAKLEDQLEMWKDTQRIANNLRPPNVELWCLYGSGYETPGKIVFEGELDSSKYHQVLEDGDGSVNLDSLRACEAFAKQQERPVFTRQFDNCNHIDILRGPNPAEFISAHILNGDLPTNNSTQVSGEK